MKTLLSLLVYICWVPFSFSQTGTIKGHVHDTSTDKGLGFAHILVVGTANGTVTNENGDFVLSGIQAGSYTIAIHYIGYTDSILAPLIVTADTVIELYVKFPPYCKYDKKKKTCPVCNKEDEVIPIVYGLLIHDPDKKSKKDRFKSGGCEVSGCDPNWYCERDNVDF